MTGDKKEIWKKKKDDLRGSMIEVTRMNNTKIMINAELIQFVEETPDTVITMMSGNKIIVKESRQEIKNRVILYKAEIFKPLLGFLSENLENNSSNALN